MAYNNYYPMNYPNFYQQAQGNLFQNGNSSQPQQNASGLIWVQGEGAAKSYLVAPGNTVALFDNESQTIYIKSADASGMPSIKILDYTFRESTPTNKQNQSVSDYATKEDVDYLKREIEALRAKFADTEGSKKK